MVRELVRDRSGRGGWTLPCPVDSLALFGSHAVSGDEREENVIEGPFPGRHRFRPESRVERRTP